MSGTKYPRCSDEAKSLMVNLKEIISSFVIELVKCLCGLPANPERLKLTDQNGNVITGQEKSKICKGDRPYIRNGSINVGSMKVDGDDYFIVSKSVDIEPRTDLRSEVLRRHKYAAFFELTGSKVKIYYVVKGGRKEMSLLKKHAEQSAEGHLFVFSRTVKFLSGKLHLDQVPEPITHYRMASIIGIDCWLEMSAFKPQVQQLRRLTRDMMPKWMSDVLVYLAGDSKSIDYCWAVFMGAVGSMLAKKIRLVIEDGDSNGLAPNLWVSLVGEPGSGKSPVIARFIRLLAKFIVDPKNSQDAKYAAILNNAIAQAIATEVRTYVKKSADDSKLIRAQSIEKDINSKYKVEKSESEGRTGAIAITTDTTVAGLTELLQFDKVSVVLIADELKSLLHTLGSKEHTKLRAQLLQAESSNSIMMVTRANQSSKSSDNATISVLSGIQPDALAPFISAAFKGDSSNDGLLNRFQLLVKNVTTIENHKPINSIQVKKYLVTFFSTVFNQSFELTAKKQGQYSVVAFSNEAKQLFIKWKVHNTNNVQSAPNKLLSSHYSKYVGLLARLSLVYQVIKNFDPKNQSIKQFDLVDVEAVNFAIKSVEYLRSHAQSIFSAEENLLHIESEFVMKRLISTGVNDFTVSELSQKDWRYIKRDPDKVLKILHYLENFGLVRAKEEVRKTVWQVNPVAKLFFK